MIKRITVDPEIHFGKPCIIGTRITVQSVLELLNEGLSFDQIIEDYYPDLTAEDVHAVAGLLTSPPSTNPIPMD